MKTRIMSPPVTFNGLISKMLLFNIFIICQWPGDLAYEISSLEVYPPIS